MRKTVPDERLFIWRASKVDSKSEDMTGVLAGTRTNYKIEEREGVGGSVLGIPGGFPPPMF